MDASIKYQVLASGEVLEGYNPDDVKTDFSKKFNIKPELAQMYFGEKPKVIKKDLDHATAQKYKVSLESMGVEVVIEDMVEPKENSALDNLSLMPLDNEQSDNDDANSTTMICPKCELEQPKAIGCEGCGIIIEKYESAQLGLQQTVTKRRTKPSKKISAAADNVRSVEAIDAGSSNGLLVNLKNKLSNLFSK